MVEISRTRIGWDDARDANRANWDSRVALHVEAYGLERFAEDPDHVSSVVRDDLPVLTAFIRGGSLEGLTLAHLQCHIGSDTVSLARAGASVTGVDFSAPALAAASALGERLGIDATWVETDVLDARAAVTAQLGPVTYDVVYTSIGTIGWLEDLDRWAAQIAGLLADGGVFYIRDGHPMLYTLHDDDEAPLVRFPYFATGEALDTYDAATYAGDGVVASPRSFEFPHALSEVAQALTGAGLALEYLGEGRTLPWRFAERMVDLGDGNFAFPGDEEAMIPCTFTMVARKPPQRELVSC